MKLLTQETKVTNMVPRVLELKEVLDKTDIKNNRDVDHLQWCILE